MTVPDAVEPPKSTRPSAGRIQIGNLWLDAVTEDDLIGIVRQAWGAGQGGSIIPVNVDVARTASRAPALAELITRGSLVVADGMPLVWASRVRGNGILSERVTGSSLMLSLSAAAAADGKSLFILGGAEGIPERAAEALKARTANLRIAGAASPEFGFDRTEEGVQQVVAAVRAVSPDLVFVGLGFPRQENLIEQLRQQLPDAWYLACGGGISMAAGVVRRASPIMQRLGLEWAHRLALEPRRLARRYLRDDLPFALALLARSVAYRLTRRRRST